MFSTSNSFPEMERSPTGNDSPVLVVIVMAPEKKSVKLGMLLIPFEELKKSEKP